MTVLRLREVAAAIFCLLTVCSIRCCNAQVIQCPNEVEVTEDGGSVVVCASADLVPASEGWNITTIDDGDAVAEMDYVRISVTVPTQLSGSAETVCIDVTIIDDAEYEGREDFSVVFTLVASGDSCTSQVDITDFEDLQDCRQPTGMSFSEDDGIVEVCVNLTGNIYSGLVVEDGTATGGGVDYRSNGVSIRITNRIETCTRVNITNDTEPENTETFAVRIIQGTSGNPLRCALTVEVQILDNDGPATIMPTETTTPPPLSGAHCSEEEYVFLTEGGTLATPARVCMSFNGNMPRVDRIAIVTEDGEHLISTPPTMDSDGDLCVEIEELPQDTIPEFNVTFYLVDPQANVQCQVKIIDETDEPTPNQPPTNASDHDSSEDPTSPLPSDEEGESGLYIGAAVGGGVLCVLIIVTMITITAICVKRKKQAREMQHEVVDIEYVDIDQTTQRKKVINTKVNVAYATRGNLIRINDNTAYGVTSGHNEPYYDYPQMQELVYDYPAL